MKEPFERPEVIAWSGRMAESFAHWLKFPLIEHNEKSWARSALTLTLSRRERDARLRRAGEGKYENRATALAKALYEAPFALVSHNHSPDPLFVYANLRAQALWGRSWDSFVGLPSRLSAEPDARKERELLLRRAEMHGYVEDYQGVRVAADSRRFRIRDTILWNVIDIQGKKLGQAAMFTEWQWL